jgi:DedD protein
MGKETAGEQELNLKKRARRRLVGAIALVLLMISTLPFLLKDRTETTTSEEVTINLPSDKSTTENKPASEQKPKPASDFDSSVVPNSPPSNPPETTAEPAAEQTPEIATKAPETTPEVADPEAAPIRETRKEKSKEPKEEAAKPEQAAKETDPTQTAEGHKFYVQVGVFSEMANVKKLQSKLTDLGYESQTEKVKTPNGEKIRLRTHTFDGRNDAAIALENIKDAGLTGMVVSQ